MGSVLLHFLLFPVLFIASTLSSSFSLRYQIVTFRNHAPDVLIRYRTVQNHRIPVLLVLMIARQHGRVSLPPEITPRRIDFHIDPHASFIFIRPQKRLSISAASYQNPVGIMKWHVLIYVRKRHAVLQRLFSRRHNLTVKVTASSFTGYVLQNNISANHDYCYLNLLQLIHNYGLIDKHSELIIAYFPEIKNLFAYWQILTATLPSELLRNIYKTLSTMSLPSRFFYSIVVLYDTYNSRLCHFTGTRRWIKNRGIYLWTKVQKSENCVRKKRSA